MANRKSTRVRSLDATETSTPRPVTQLAGKTFGPLYRGFIARLKQLGCVYCPQCVAYVYPENHAHAVAATATERKAA